MGELSLHQFKSEPPSDEFGGTLQGLDRYVALCLENPIDLSAASPLPMALAPRSVAKPPFHLAGERLPERRAPTNLSPAKTTTIAKHEATKSMTKSLTLACLVGS